jgi:hypothetical protein
MRFKAGLLTWLTLALAGPSAVAQQPPPGTPPTVLELFTSQGCSSCPPADKLLRGFAERADLIALSFSVDYWDHLGWKDTLALPKNTARQKAYAKALGTGNIYTPQLVIHGAAQAIGSHKTDIDKAIADVRRDKSQRRVELAATRDGKRLTIEVAAAPAGAPAINATVWLAVVAPLVEVDVKRGENRGRKLLYHNVVRDITPVGMWSGQMLRIDLPASVSSEPGARCAVIVQGEDGGRILAATWLTQ